MLLRQLLYRCDIRFLPIIAGHWLRLQKIPDYEELIRMLCDRMLDRAFLQKKLASPDSGDLLPALKRLVIHDGLETTDSFEEAIGPFRIAGIERIQREKLWQNPISATEKLWYNGMIFRENRAVGGELKTCYLLPDDLRIILAPMIPEEIPTTYPRQKITVRPAIPSETVAVMTVDETLPDLICLASALMLDKRPLVFPGGDFSETCTDFINMILNESGFYKNDMETNTEAIRAFLTQNRTAMKIEMIKFWRKSDKYNELEKSPELKVITSPQFDKTKPRETVIQLLSELSPDIWFSVSGFLAAIKKADTGFLRKFFQGGSGRILDLDDNDLSGIGSWFQLEGAYLRFMLSGPLNWLGLVRLAYTDKNKSEISAFRINKETLFYLNETAEDAVPESIRQKPNLEQEIPTIAADGAITCSTKTPRYFRYMLTRYCEIEKYTINNTIFRITPASLTLAEKHGLSRKSLLLLLQRFSKNKVPPALERMLSAGDSSSLSAAIYTATILTLPNRDILSELLETTRLEKWILQQITPTSLLIDKKGIGEIRRFLMEREIFVDIQV